jgi:hypothetical protein
MAVYGLVAAFAVLLFLCIASSLASFTDKRLW